MNRTEKPSKFSGIIWVLFAATATFSAFFLPIFIYGWMPEGYYAPPNIFFLIFFFLVVFSALYHSFYRIKTIALDLGLGKYEKMIVILLSTLFGILLGMTVYTFVTFSLFLNSSMM